MLTIAVETLRAWLAEGRPVTMLDVRPAAERDEWSIPGSIHIDAYDALKANNPQALDGVILPENEPVVTICGAGKTSLTAARQLQARGIHALSLEGGMQAWSLAWNSAEVPLPGSGARVIQVRRTGKGCLSYLIGSEGLAAVVDPSLPPQVYLDLAQAHGWRIALVLETHIHADHLSRGRDLAARAQAHLSLPEQRRVSYAFMPVREGTELVIGAARLSALHTPGHTPESTCMPMPAKRASRHTGSSTHCGGSRSCPLKPPSYRVIAATQWRLTVSLSVRRMSPCASGWECAWRTKRHLSPRSWRACRRRRRTTSASSPTTRPGNSLNRM